MSQAKVFGFAKVFLYISAPCYRGGILGDGPTTGGSAIHNFSSWG